MAENEYYRIEKSTLENTSNAIREMLGETDRINPLDWPDAIYAIEGSGEGSDIPSDFSTGVFSVIQTQCLYHDVEGMEDNVIEVYHGLGAKPRLFMMLILPSDDTLQLRIITELTMIRTKMKEDKVRHFLRANWNNSSGGSPWRTGSENIGDDESVFDFARWDDEKITIRGTNQYAAATYSGGVHIQGDMQYVWVAYK